MANLSVRPLQPADLDPIAALLAARHARDSANLPAMDPALLDPGACASVLAAALGDQRSNGAVAVRDGAIIGFLLGERMLLPPDHVFARYIAPHSISMGITSHAVAAGEDAVTVYRELYAALAEGWAGEGFFVHTANIPAGDADVQEAWVALGFGRTTTAAVRDTSAVPASMPAGVEVHQAGPEDIGAIVALSGALERHHAGGPIFWPVLHDADRAVHAAHVHTLADPGNAHFVAYREGTALGMQTFWKPGFTPSTVSPRESIYLYEGVVDSEVRSGGVGSALLAHSLDWCREQGYDWCCLHYASANPSGAPFWQRQGFVAVEYIMQRHIDERIAWANR
ncbi:MAG: GNAT family N-acetyltransferase [Tepidiformaceae bacterium]